MERRDRAVSLPLMDFIGVPGNYTVTATELLSGLSSNTQIPIAGRSSP